jgi:predicted MFS family arabinose efflux permease
VALLALLLLTALPPSHVPEHRAPLPPGGGRASAAWRAHLTSVLVNFTGFAIPLLVPYYLARVAVIDAAAIGLMLAAASTGVLAGATIAPRLIRAMGQRKGVLLAAGLVALAQGVIAAWPLAPATGALLPGLVLHGIGIGVFQVVYADTVMAGAAEARHGAAGSLTVLTRTLGVIASALVLSSVLQMLEAQALAEELAATAAFHQAFRGVMLLSGLGLAVFVAAMAWRRGGVTPLRG